MLNVFLSAGNNPGVLKNSTEHTETLFIAFRQFPQVNSVQLTTMYQAYARVLGGLGLSYQIKLVTALPLVIWLVDY